MTRLYEDVQQDIIKALTQSGFSEVEINWIESSSGGPGYDVQLYVGKPEEEDEE